MSKPVHFFGCNTRMLPPEGSENVEPMPVFRNGVCCVSAWELTDEEILEVIKSRRIFLAVLSGVSQPPVYVGTEREVRGMVADYGVWEKDPKA